MDGISQFQAPRPVVVQQQQNPWNLVLPNLVQSVIGNMVAAKVKQNMDQQLMRQDFEQRAALQGTPVTPVQGQQSGGIMDTIAGGIKSFFGGQQPPQNPVAADASPDANGNAVPAQTFSVGGQQYTMPEAVPVTKRLANGMEMVLFRGQPHFYKPTTDTYVNLSTGEQRKIAENDPIPPGFVGQTFAAAALTAGRSQDSADRADARQQKGFEHQEKMLQDRLDAAENKPAKPTFQQQAAIDAFVEKNKRQPTAQEKEQILQNSQTGESAFANWPKDEQESTFKDKILTGKEPRFAWGDKVSYNEFQKGYRAYLNSKNIDPSDIQAIQGKVKADQKALAKNEERLAATEQFANTIRGGSAEMLRLREQYGNEFPKLMSQAVNNIKQGTVGDGDVAALQFAMFSLSREAAKVESGSLGIAEVSVDTAKALSNIMSYNYQSADLEKLFGVVNKFADIRKKSIEDESTTLEEKIKDPASYKKLTSGAGKPPQAQQQTQPSGPSTASDYLKSINWGK